MNVSTQSANRFIREAECKELTGLSRTTRWRMERDGAFPSRRQLSPNAVGWRLSEVIGWLESRKRRTYRGEAADADR